MSSFWERLLNLLSVLWSRDSREAMRRSEIRKLRLALRSLQPPVYRHSTSQLLPGFAERVLALRQHLAPIAALLGATLRNAEPRLADRYRDELVELRLPDDLLSRLELLREEALRERLAASPAPAEELHKADLEMAELLRASTYSACGPIDEELTDLELLADLCQYDFLKLLRWFDPRLPSDADPAAATRHRFQAVSGLQVLGELEDLHFVLAPLRISEGMERDLVVLLVRLQRERASETREPLIQALARLRSFLEHSLNPSILLSLIRILQGDPFLQITFPRQQRPALKPYLDRFIQRYRAAGERLLRETREKALDQEIRKLFPGAELLEIGGYGEALGRSLAEAGFTPFGWVRPLRLLRSFACAHFERGIREGVSRLVEEGVFADPAFQENLGAAFRGCDAIREKIDGFEEQMRGADPVSSRALQEQLNSHLQGRPAGATLNRIVEAIDGKARMLVETGAAALYNLGSLLFAALIDLKAASPERVKNLKSIGGARNREFLQSLAQSYGTIRSFVSVLGHFTPLPGAADCAGGSAASAAGAAGGTPPAGAAAVGAGGSRGAADVPEPFQEEEEEEEEK